MSAQKTTTRVIELIHAELPDSFAQEDSAKGGLGLRGDFLKAIPQSGLSQGVLFILCKRMCQMFCKPGSRVPSSSGWFLGAQVPRGAWISGSLALFCFVVLCFALQKLKLSQAKPSSAKLK